MPAVTVSQEQKNVQAQVDAWDAQIERYAHQASTMDEYTKQAFLDELIRLQAKREQFSEMLSAMSPVTVVSDDTNVANEDTEDYEPTDEELEQIRQGTFDDDLDDDSSEDDDDDEEDLIVNNYSNNAEYRFREMIQLYSHSAETVFPKFLIK